MFGKKKQQAVKPIPEGAEPVLHSSICTGETAVNREISDNLMLFLKRRDAESICVVQCGDSAVRDQRGTAKDVLT